MSSENHAIPDYLTEVCSEWDKDNLTRLYAKEYELYKAGKNKGLGLYYSSGYAATPDYFRSGLDSVDLLTFSLNSNEIGVLGWGEIHNYLPIPELSYYIASEHRQKRWGSKLVSGLMLYVRDILRSPEISIEADLLNEASHNVFQSAARSLGYSAANYEVPRSAFGVGYKGYVAKVNFEENKEQE